MYHGVHIKVKGQLEGVDSLFLSHGSRGLNSGHQVSVFLPAKLSLWPSSSVFGTMTPTEPEVCPFG